MAFDRGLAWPPAAVQALRTIGVDLPAAIRADGRLSLHALGVRVDLQPVGAGAIVLSSPLGRLPGSKAARDELIVRALRCAAGGLGTPSLTLAIADGSLWLQQRLDGRGEAEFDQRLAAFFAAAVRWREQLGGGHTAARAGGALVSTRAWREASDGHAHR